MYLNPPPLSLLHSRQAALTQARSALPDAPVVAARPHRLRHQRPSAVSRSVVATRRASARTLHRFADVVAPTDRPALVR